MQKTADGVNVWFWSRWDPTVPHEIKTGADNVNPGLAWGLPAAKFPVTTCDYASHFNAHQIIFDLTLCVSLSYPIPRNDMYELFLYI